MGAGLLASNRQANCSDKSMMEVSVTVDMHYNDVIMSAMTSQITGVSIVCSSVGSGADQRKYQSSASLAFVWGSHQWPVNSPHKWPVTRKMFPFDDVIMDNMGCNRIARLFGAGWTQSTYNFEIIQKWIPKAVLNGFFPVERMLSDKIIAYVPV